MRLSKAELAALQYLFSHRAEGVKAGDDCMITSLVMSRLNRKGLVKQNQRRMVLTSIGEQHLRSL